MRIVAHNLGQILYLVPSEEMRPVRPIQVRDLIDKIAERYRFLSIPDLSKPWEELNAEGFKFNSGRLMHEGEPINVSEFGIYNDGLVVNCRTTEDADLFLADVLGWGRAEFGLKKPIRPPRVLYHSNVVVEFDRRLSGLIKEFGKLAKSLTGAYADQYGIKDSADISRIAFQVDPLQLPAGSPRTEFALERRVERAFGEERYVASAPLQSSVHIKLLEELEAVAK